VPSGQPMALLRRSRVPATPVHPGGDRIAVLAGRVDADETRSLGRSTSREIDRDHLYANSPNRKSAKRLWNMNASA
jgi:hypothetical protein